MKSFTLISLFLLALISQSQLDINIVSNSSILYGYAKSDLTPSDAKLFPSANIAFKNSLETPLSKIIFPSSATQPPALTNAKWIGPNGVFPAPITIFTTNCFANVCPSNLFAL